MEANGVLTIEPNALGENSHICAFFNSMDDHYRVLRSFITEGFHQGERAFHIVDPERREDPSSDSATRASTSRRP